MKRIYLLDSQTKHEDTSEYVQFNKEDYTAIFFLFPSSLNSLIRLILQSPLVLGHESVNDLLHREIRDELLDRQWGSCDGVEVTDALQMLFDVFPLVSDAGWSDDGVLEDLEADFAADVVGDFAFSSAIIDFGE